MSLLSRRPPCYLWELLKGDVPVSPLDFDANADRRDSTLKNNAGHLQPD
ncbi:hypothetical protein SBDP1_290054 [Syntrophobacter sp. SbD1]|nr:hypothetical protein SBDP1_290054 [Syntrophobacter sp. SbD1]